MASILRTLQIPGVSYASKECLLIFLLYLVTFACTYGQRVVFTEPNTQTNPSVTLQRMILDESTGMLYVGSVNTIYKLSEDLTVVLQERTGPVLDHQACFPPPGPCTDSKERETVDNVNKLLVVDGEKLITCGSVYQGTCQTRNVSNFAIVGNNTQEEVAVNTRGGTTIGFVSNGPIGNVLYVASSHAAWIDRTVPTISSRRIAPDNSKELFKIVAKDQLSNGAKIVIPEETLNAVSGKFNITYVYGFPSGNFSYFVGIQPVNEKIPESLYKTKLARVCQMDYDYFSYIELPLVCMKDGTNYNLAQSAYVTQLGADLDPTNFKKGEKVLFVTFARSNGKSMNVLEESAICMYSLKFIDLQFWQRRKDCASGLSSSFDISWQGTQNQKCFRTPLVNTIEAAGPQYCHTTNFLYPLGGTTPIQQTAIFTNMSLLTAIAATPHLEETVIFAGDNFGNVKKLWITDLNTANFVEEEAVSDGGDEQIVKNGLIFNRDKNFLYAMTPTKITKLPVEQCEKHETCDECLGVGNGIGDPYCGWCTLQNRCTRRTDAECGGSVDTMQANRWLGKNDQCIKVMKVTPDSTSKDKREQLTLNVRSLPTLTGSESYSCVFTNPESSSTIGRLDAVVDGSNVTCSTPPLSALPNSLPGFLRVKLSIATDTAEKIVNTDFDFYDCNKFTNCIDCVNNAYKCDWCIFNNTCTGNANVCGDGSGIVGSREPKQPAVTDKLGPDFCPQVVVGSEIFIPAGVTRGFNVSAMNLPIPPKGSNPSYMCVLSYENREESVAATRVSDREVQCQDRSYDYDTVTNNLAVVLTIQWGNNNAAIDNPDAVVVNLYKCGVKRDNCGECLAANKKYKCGWCDSKSSSQKRLMTSKAQCSIEPQCTGGGTEWLHGNTICPNPTIIQFEPMAGHVEGGTNLTIKGINLGQRTEDIRSITVAGLACQQIVELYQTASQVVCRTSGRATKAAGIIEIEIGDTGDMYSIYRARSVDKFEYVIPVITMISPTEGPASGGTKITITGENLNAGSSISATVAGKPCEITSLTEVEAVCVTSPAVSGMNGTFSMNFDHGTVEARNTIEYVYSPNPTITGFDRFKSIQSGGLNISVDGTGLDLVQFPMMVFSVDNKDYTSPCEVIKSTMMLCPTPDVSSSGKKSPYEIKKDNYGFLLDGLTNYTTMSDIPGIQNFEIHPDPFYHKFDTDVLKLNIDQQKYLYLEIEGENLTLASNEKDVRVRVGLEDCTNILLNRERLTCDAPKKKPDSRQGDPYPVVVVTHGNLNFTVGYVQYKGDAIDQVLVIGATAGAILALLIILLITLVYYRKATENERLVKQMEQQRDALELRVAQECKEAFAELQTDMTTLTSNLGGSGIPYLDYRFYSIRTLFPDQPNHSVLKELSQDGRSNRNNKIPTASRAHIEKGLIAFGHLIDNKTFLLCFIHTLEEQKGFSLKDMSNVASLIMVVLQGKMEYATEVLKVLLADLIEKHVEKDRARLLMRRNESVAEKMVSNWLSFLLYNFIRENAGEPLFMLYYAIKQQVEKGPVDAITGEARYGLSEVKVIRQQIDYNFLTIYAIGLDRDADPVQVRVLDCDTISQVKEKILDVVYKTIPYSHRPPKEELDLEWRCGLQGKMILQDDDGSKVPEGEWKKLNTLATYEIRNGATIALVPKQGFTMSAFSTSSTRYMNVSATSSPCRSTTPMLNSESDNGVKQWHLVKPSDTENLKGDGERDHKMMAEIYLPRLLTTKGTLQKFVDDLFETIFSVNMRGNTLPLAIKYLFDFLDDQARLHEITNPDIVHSWKSNSLPLRFWVNLIKNPDLIFDTYKSETVDACLSIIGQTLMDACSVSEHQLTKDSPSSKLLYAKDIPTYKEWVSRYYKDIQALPSISDQDMAAMLAEHSHNHQYDFHTMTALNELYFYYACTYKGEILKALEEDEFAQKHRLADRFGDISRLIADPI